jgi:hypothetical protein
MASRCLIEFVRGSELGRWCNPRQYKFNDNSIISLSLCTQIAPAVLPSELPAAPPNDLIRPYVSLFEWWDQRNAVSFEMKRNPKKGRATCF